MSTRSSWCNTHRGPTERAIAVAVIEVNSGPGGTVWSCPDCVARYGIVPLDEQSPDHPASRIQYRDARPPRDVAADAPVTDAPAADASVATEDAAAEDAAAEDAAGAPGQP
ncbi:hypothetical protein OYE22_08640 [Streptomyces sp. 71268]|uniref:hypothetical protein n=1 Tax=Streptomyces sp. 71268 TaxID=3002640 RepID=UPI0023F9C287|nr:hypothetical protein [Streptomyces sp. 71268]WEV25250.1 hypothetical protein OYE22_08640 [Streptomyces sp. 71268]